MFVPYAQRAAATESEHWPYRIQIENRTRVTMKRTKYKFKFGIPGVLVLAV